MGKLLNMVEAEFPKNQNEADRINNVLFWKSIFFNEMIVRSFKTILNASLRQEMEKGGNQSIGLDFFIIN